MCYLCNEEEICMDLILQGIAEQEQRENNRENKKNGIDRKRENENSSDNRNDNTSSNKSNCIEEKWLEREAEKTRKRLLNEGENKESETQNNPDVACTKKACREDDSGGSPETLGSLGEKNDNETYREAQSIWEDYSSDSEWEDAFTQGTYDKKMLELYRKSGNNTAGSSESNTTGATWGSNDGREPSPDVEILCERPSTSSVRRYDFKPAMEDAPNVELIFAEVMYPDVKPYMHHMIIPTSNYFGIIDEINQSMVRYNRTLPFAKWILSGFDCEPNHSHVHVVHACNKTCECRFFASKQFKKGECFNKKAEVHHTLNLIKYILQKHAPQYLYGRTHARMQKALRVKEKEILLDEVFNEFKPIPKKIDWVMLIHRELQRTIGLSLDSIWKCPAFDNPTLKVKWMHVSSHRKEDVFYNAFEEFSYQWRHNTDFYDKLKFISCEDNVICDGLRTNDLSVSIEIIMRVLKNTYDNWEKFVEFMDMFINWLEGNNGKKNTLYVVSPPSACKNLLFENLGWCFGGPEFVGVLVPVLNRQTSNFKFETFVKKCLGFWDEPVIAPNEVESILTLCGGNRTVANIKGKKQKEFYNMPLLITANPGNSFDILLAQDRFEKRVWVRHWKMCHDEVVVNNRKSLHHRAFAKVMLAYLEGREHFKYAFYDKY